MENKTVPIEPNSVWETLAKINVTDYTDTKGKLTFIAWTWSWQIMMQHYPATTYSFQDNEYHQDGSVTVHVTVTCEGQARQMWLAVTDDNMRSIKNPGCSFIANAKMRCLTKCLAMFGLGFHVYARESLPLELVEPPQPDAIIDGEQLKDIKRLIGLSDTDEIKFCNHIRVQKLEAIPEQIYDKAVALLEKKLAVKNAALPNDQAAA